MARDRGQAHPISDKNLKNAIQNISPDGDSVELSTRELSDALIHLQDWFQDHLGELVRERQEEGTWDTLSERLNAFNKFYINTYDYLLLENLSTDPSHFLNTFDESSGVPGDEGQQRAIWEAHRLQFEELTESRNLRRISNQPPQPDTTPVVVRKSYSWIGGENIHHFDIDLLLKAGLSPAEALDYIYTNQMSTGTAGWAEKRGVSRQAISQNVKRAKHKLEREFQ